MHQAEAVLYYNNSDISKGRKGLSPAVEEYCVEDHNCFRLTLLKYFGFDNVLFEGDKKFCCSNCKKHSKLNALIKASFTFCLNNNYNIFS